MKKIINLFKQYWKMIIIIVLFIGTVPYFTYLLVTIPAPFGIGFINDSNRDTWINFFGSIIGGGATLFGVWWTIKENEKQRREDLAIQYRPCLNIREVAKEPPNFSAYNRVNYELSQIPDNIYLENIKVNHDLCRLTLKLSNTGRGDLEHLVLKEVTLDAPAFESSFFYKEQFLTSIPKDQSFYIEFVVPPLLILKDNALDYSNKKIDIQLKILSTDEFSYNTFLTIINLSFDVSIEPALINNNKKIVISNYTVVGLKEQTIIIKKKC